MVQRDPDLTCRQARKLEADERARKRREARKAALDRKGHPVTEPPTPGTPGKVAVRLGLIALGLVLTSGCPDGEKRELKGDKEVSTEGSSKAPSIADEKKKGVSKEEKTPSKPDEKEKVPAEGEKK